MVTLVRAVVVGINEYMDRRYRDRARLQFARSDAEEVARVLRTSSTLRPEQIHLYRDMDATRRAVQEGLDEVFSDHFPGQNTIALFYFAGHGLHNPKDSRISLCCSDVDFHDPNAGGIRLNDIYELLMQCSAEYAIAIIDACYSGGIIDQGYFYHKSPAEHAKSALETLRWANGKTIAIFASCRENQRTRESKTERHGVYTSALLHGWRDGEARGSDGAVTLTGLADYIARRFAGDNLIPRFSLLGGRPVLLWQGEPPPPPALLTPQQPEPFDGIVFRPGTSKVPRKRP